MELILTCFFLMMFWLAFGLVLCLTDVIHIEKITTKEFGVFLIVGGPLMVVFGIICIILEMFDRVVVGKLQNWIDG